jgi:uncharacterized protein (TIGR02757 family)
MGKIKALLDKEVCERNSDCELSYEKPDPLLIAHRQEDEYAILLCALFAYGNVNLIVKFLDSLDFSLLNASEETIKKALSSHYYRFQNSKDVIAIFIALSRLKQQDSLENIFMKGYEKEQCVLEGIDGVIEAIYNAHDYHSQGYTFLVSSKFKRNKEEQIKHSGNGAYKRWHMFLRWMVRKDKLDLGLWKNVATKDLMMPLDTHTFKVSQKMGLLKRKTYDLKSVIELTQTLKTFDKNDPIKYDFALYRIGQEQLI